jgi:microcystin-dependent protein
MTGHAVPASERPVVGTAQARCCQEEEVDTHTHTHTHTHTQTHTSARTVTVVGDHPSPPLARRGSEEERRGDDEPLAHFAGYRSAISKSGNSANHGETLPLLPPEPNSITKTSATGPAV